MEADEKFRVETTARHQLEHEQDDKEETGKTCPKHKEERKQLSLTRDKPEKTSEYNSDRQGYDYALEHQPGIGDERDLPPP